MASKCILFSLLAALCYHAAESRIIKPASSAELQSALDSASPGDTIQLLPMVYMGEFTITKDSSPNVPITITGDYNSTIMSEGTAAFTVKGNNWVLKSFKITGPSIGILLEGSGNTLESIVLQAIGQGIVVRGPDNKIRSCVISEAGGGVILESGDRTEMKYNSINIQNPSIIVTEQTCCGLLDGNVANGMFEVRGNGYMLQNNVANHGLHISGCDNSLSGNVANGASFPKTCDIKDLGGNVYRGTGPNDTDEPGKYGNNNVNSDYNGNPGQAPQQGFANQGGTIAQRSFGGNPAPQGSFGGQQQGSYQQNSAPQPQQQGSYQQNSAPQPQGSYQQNSVGPQPQTRSYSANSVQPQQGSYSNSVAAPQQQGPSYATNPGGQGKPPCRCTCEWDG